MKMLEGDRNWRTWKIQMKALVMEKKLWGYVDVKVQREALAESSVVFGRVFGNKVGRRLMV